MDEAPCFCSGSTTLGGCGLPSTDRLADRFVAGAKGFVVLPKRWVVERTLAWLNRCRRLAKDWENLNRKARAFLLLASIRLMVRRLCRASG
jgi:transposase